MAYVSHCNKHARNFGRVNIFNTMVTLNPAHLSPIEKFFPPKFSSMRAQALSSCLS